MLGLYFPLSFKIFLLNTFWSFLLRQKTKHAIQFTHRCVNLLCNSLACCLITLTSITTQVSSLDDFQLMVNKKDQSSFLFRSGLVLLDIQFWRKKVYYILLIVNIYIQLIFINRVMIFNYKSPTVKCKKVHSHLQNQIDCVMFLCFLISDDPFIEQNKNGVSL